MATAIPPAGSRTLSALDRLDYRHQLDLTPFVILLKTILAFLLYSTSSCIVQF